MNNQPPIEQTALGMTLQASVPFKILAIKESGGMTVERLEWLKRPEVDGILERADSTILYGENTAEGFNTMADVIALMSFVEGGIHIFGTHWDATREFPFWSGL